MLNNDNEANNIIKLQLSDTLCKSSLNMASILVTVKLLKKLAILSLPHLNFILGTLKIFFEIQILSICKVIIISTIVFLLTK